MSLETTLGSADGAEISRVHADTVTSIVAWLRPEVEDAKYTRNGNMLIVLISHQPTKTPTTNLLADFLLVALENMGF